MFQSRNRIVETAAVEKQPVFQFLYPCNQSIEMEIEVFGGFIHMIIQDGMDGLIDLQFLIFFADHGKAVVADVLDDGIVGGTV